MATADICDTFSIVVEGLAANVASSFTATRVFTVVGIQATNGAAGARTLICSGATAGTFTATAAGVAGTGVVQAQAVGGPNMPVGVFASNATIGKNEVVSLTVSNVAVTKVVLSCIGTPQSLTIS